LLGIAISGESWIGEIQRDFIYIGTLGIICSLLFTLGFSGSALATHEADHRFTISGYVRDAAGKPLSGSLVILEHKGGVKKEKKSDPRGYYEVMFHLHNDNIGDEIFVSVGDVVRKIMVQFDPDDRFTDRRSEPVNFGAASKDTSEWIYWSGGVALILSALVYLRAFKKKKPRQKRRKKDKIRKRK